MLLKTDTHQLSTEPYGGQLLSSFCCHIFLNLNPHRPPLLTLPQPTPTFPKPLPNLPCPQNPLPRLAGWLRCFEGGAVLDAVFVDAPEVEEFGIAGGGARQQSLPPLSHQPFGAFGGHLPGDVLPHPCVNPGLEAQVQPSADPLVRLLEKVDG